MIWLWLVPGVDLIVFAMAYLRLDGMRFVNEYLPLDAFRPFTPCTTPMLHSRSFDMAPNHPSDGWCGFFDDTSKRPELFCREWSIIPWRVSWWTGTPWVFWLVSNSGSQTDITWSNKSNCSVSYLNCSLLVSRPCLHLFLPLVPGLRQEKKCFFSSYSLIKLWCISGKGISSSFSYT